MSDYFIKVFPHLWIWIESLFITSPTVFTFFLSTRGCYALEFKGYIHGKSIAGPSVNLTLLPDPNKPVRLSVDFDKNAKFFAGGKFPGLYFLVLGNLFFYLLF